MRRSPEALAHITAYLMGGSAPDQIHKAHVSRVMDIAEAILDEADKRAGSAEEPPAPEQQ